MDAGKAGEIAATGEIRKDFIDLWIKEKLKLGATVNPPGVMASALNVAVLMLQGKELKEPAKAGQYGTALYLPIPFIDSKNVAEAAKQLEGKPGVLFLYELAFDRGGGSAVQVSLRRALRHCASRGARMLPVTLCLAACFYPSIRQDLRKHTVADPGQRPPNRSETDEFPCRN